MGVIMKSSATIQGLLFITIISMLIGCMSAHQHYQQTHGTQERQMTVGTVQKEIRKGMSAAEVAETLGSPNIVTTDAEGREVWVYDKIYNRSAGATSTTQRTLTVVIKFDEQKIVRDFAYHTSRF
jgi:outer membrane protein assembly factor BamE (lipoprotein component of BamABCDE complex)